MRTGYVRKTMETWITGKGRGLEGTGHKPVRNEPHFFCSGDYQIQPRSQVLQGNTWLDIPYILGTLYVVGDDFLFSPNLTFPNAAVS